jgi:two-component system, chemotaxis family, CheB/CheR fusion protein
LTVANRRWPTDDAARAAARNPPTSPRVEAMAKKTRKVRRRGDEPRKPRAATRRRQPATRREPEPPRRAPAAVDGAVGTDGLDATFPIVGIGASAGGLEAMSEVLRLLPPDTHMAFVIVQHLAPRHDSLLAGLLRNCTAMPIVEVAQGTTVQPDHVYVIPPDTSMGLMHGVLHLLPRAESQQPHMPIDFFLRSLAEDQKNNAIGVILSGTGSDGALGMRMVKGQGGITIVQDPRSAKYDGMPRAAIGTGDVDLALPLEGIADELVKISRHPLLAGTRTRAAVFEAEDVMKRVFFLLKQAGGVDFTHYKHATIQRRLKRRMVLHRIESLAEYLAHLEADPKEVHALYQDMLIHVTGFFREPEAFAALREVVFPHVLAQRHEQAPLRIWVAGCSTGEETYSIAITLQEHLDGTAHSGAHVQIFATDVSQTAVDNARAGFYPENITADVSADRLRRFFVPMDGGFRVAKSLRDMCIFARQDLTKDPPFSQLDLVSCRNVMIYLGPVLQKRAMSIFHYALKATGFLLLGTSETIGSHADLFAVADKQHKIYTKKVPAGRQLLGFTADYTQHRSEPQKLPFTGRVRDQQIDIDRMVLDRLAPTGVVVNADLQIVQVRGQTGKYLEPAIGEATFHLLKMARPGLMIELRTAMHSARKHDRTVVKKGVRVKHDGHVGIVDIEIQPIDAPTGERLWLILFHDQGPTAPVRAKKTRGKSTAAKTPEDSSRQTTAQLEQELEATRDYLHSIIHDQEATNDELQSANEEILSSNEELQSTNEELETAKEELQSTNEELNTLNEELQTRNQELSQANNDLTNLLACVHIPILMIGNDLRIRRFTPMAANVFNLIPGDVGRPITDIKPKVEVPNLGRLIGETIDTVTMRELEVRHADGRFFTMRLRPYKTIDNRIDGCVVALVDIPFSKRTWGDQPPVSLMDRGIFVLDEGLRIRTANERFCRTHNVVLDKLLGRRFDQVLNGLLATPSIGAILEGAASGPDPADDLETVHDVQDVEGRPIRMSACRLAGDPDVILVELAAEVQPDDESSSPRS